jgi:hypothetical protein
MSVLVRQTQIAKNKIALKRKEYSFPVLTKAIKRSIQVSLCSAEIIPNSIPKTIAITIAKKG